VYKSLLPHLLGAIDAGDTVEVFFVPAAETTDVSKEITAAVPATPRAEGQSKLITEVCGSTRKIAKSAWAKVLTSLSNESFQNTDVNIKLPP
jgi:hypothetical protein